MTDKDENIPDNNPELNQNSDDNSHSNAEQTPIVAPDSTDTLSSPGDSALPADGPAETPPLPPKKRRTRRLIIWLIVAAVLLTGVGYVIATYMNMANNPASYFNQDPTATPSATPSPLLPSITPEPTPSPTVDPYAALEGQADLSFNKNIINVLLIGVDYSQERDSNDDEYVGKDFNSDVMMIAAIDFEKKTANLISVPRDTYAKIANAEGPYKLNFSLQLGGGMTDAGFMNVCKSVEWVLGGVPVNYYAAVTIPVLKEIVDILGGIDIEVEMDYKIQGRSYVAGMQHLDGQGVVDYCRVRKNIPKAGDQYRVNRQKAVMLELFRKMKSTQSILKTPEIMKALEGKLFTNLSAEQIAALAVFGYSSLDPANVGMHTFSGTGASVFNFNYVLTNQKKRVDTIQDIYGVTVKQIPQYDNHYVRLQWAAQQTQAFIEIVQKGLERAPGLESLVYTQEYISLMQAVDYAAILVEDANHYLEDIDTTKGLSAEKNAELERQHTELALARDNMQALAQMLFDYVGYNPGRWYCDAYPPEDGAVRMRE